MGTSDYGPGTLRLSFLVVRSDGKLVLQPRARVWLATGGNARPFLETTARLERVGGAGHDLPSTSIYVARVRVRSAGTYRLVVEPIGGAPIQGFQDIRVPRRPAAVAVGEQAPVSDTPTLASTHGALAALTTAVPPDRSLLRFSVRDTLRAHLPFVLVFATPRFCSSRMCGPVVDVVAAAQRQLGGSGLRFIHVEIYEDNDVSKGPNRWVRQWRLPSEPFTYLVDARGRVVERIEGAYSLAELEAAIRTRLLRRA